MLAAYAVRSESSRGRKHPEPEHAYRDIFQRDRDRVIHSRAFRRLENKTQVFTRRYSDHFRNRLTHTIEVAQISRTIAAELNLNVDLVETLALVHDIGHPPFGHAGEHALDAPCTQMASPLTTISTRCASLSILSSAMPIFVASTSASRSAKASSSTRAITRRKNIRSCANICLISAPRSKRNSSTKLTRSHTSPLTSTMGWNQISS